MHKKVQLYLYVGLKQLVTNLPTTGIHSTELRAFTESNSKRNAIWGKVQLGVEGS